jgi:uncharacterized glyoxalase superfamily protein PhnB
MTENTDLPVLFVCHGDDGGPRFHPCRRVQEALREADVPFEKVIAAQGSPLPFLRRGSREDLRARTGDTKLPAMLLPDGTVLSHSREILDWVATRALERVRRNRSAPPAAVTPVLRSPDVQATVDWLVEVLGFVERVRIGPGHRAQLAFGSGSLIVAEAGEETFAPLGAADSVMLRVVGIDALWERACAAGAEALAAPQDHPYGERQCSFHDPDGHRWTLTETVRDVAPEEWGGMTIGS